MFFSFTGDFCLLYTQKFTTALW